MAERAPGGGTMQGKLETAKYAGNCAECGNRFYMADDIVVVTDSTGQHAYHANCADLLGIETTKAVCP